MSAAAVLVAALLFAPVGVVAAGEVTLPSEVVLNGVEFVRVPAGEFWYSVQSGYPPSERPREVAPRRDVKIFLDTFYIARYEARAADFARFLNHSGWRADRRSADAERQEGVFCTLSLDPVGGFVERSPGGRLPATGVSWRQAEAFARWMGFRLPSEAEWQKAARGADRRIWPWGDDYPDDTVAHYAMGRGCKADPVDRYPRGASLVGAYNMGGNVAEWTANWFSHEFDRTLRDGAENPPPPKVADDSEAKLPRKIAKGGGWGNGAAAAAVAARVTHEVDHEGTVLGVRFVVDAATVEAELRRQASAPASNQ